MVKKSIRIEDYIYEVVEKKMEKISGNNFTSYINMLIYQDNKEELDKKQAELEQHKPVRVSKFKKATFNSTCPFCRKVIKVNTDICNARFPDGQERFVHRKCSKMKLD